MRLLVVRNCWSAWGCPLALVSYSLRLVLGRGFVAVRLHP